MTPKEKAIELFDEFYKIIPIDTYNIPNISAQKKAFSKYAKKCILIMSDNIMNLAIGIQDIVVYKYWEEVKKEIEKL